MIDTIRTDHEDFICKSVNMNTTIMM